MSRPRLQGRGHPGSHPRGDLSGAAFGFGAPPSSSAFASLGDRAATLGPAAHPWAAALGPRRAVSATMKMAFDDDPSSKDAARRAREKEHKDMEEQVREALRADDGSDGDRWVSSVRDHLADMYPTIMGSEASKADARAREEIKVKEEEDNKKRAQKKDAPQQQQRPDLSQYDINALRAIVGGGYGYPPGTYNPFYPMYADPSMGAGMMPGMPGMPGMPMPMPMMPGPEMSAGAGATAPGPGGPPAMMPGIVTDMTSPGLPPGTTFPMGPPLPGMPGMPPMASMPMPSMSMPGPGMPMGMPMLPARPGSAPAAPGPTPGQRSATISPSTAATENEFEAYLAAQQAQQQHAQMYQSMQQSQYAFGYPYAYMDASAGPAGAPPVPSAPQQQQQRSATMPMPTTMPMGMPAGMPGMPMSGVPGAGGMPDMSMYAQQQQMARTMEVVRALDAARHGGARRGDAEVFAEGNLRQLAGGY